MKKTAAIGGIILIILACNTPEDKQMPLIGDSVLNESMLFDSIHIADSFSMASVGTTRIELNYMYPKQSDSPVAQSILMWICMQRNDAGMTYYNDLRQSAISEVTHWMEYNTIQLECESTRRKKNNEDLCGDMFTENYEHIKVIYEDSEYITMEYYAYIYMNGTHGNYVLHAATFNKATGAYMGWKLIEGVHREKLMVAVKEQLKQYFGIQGSRDENGYVYTEDEQLKKCLLTDSITLPDMPPYITEDGITFTYQTYEIAAYCWGIIQLNINRNRLYAYNKGGNRHK